ncbi:MAG: GNAT family N-acetyltransferase [Gammaproteobacteria bacterium]|nr:GNAT family N-acetyltransferase [Gammaproteobacteria bacterium]
MYHTEYQICTWPKFEEQIRDIRTAVFINEQQVPEELEIDEQDQTCLHIVALIEGIVVATGRLLDDGHIGRMCVLKGFRNQGIGLTMLELLIDAAEDKGIKEVKVNAQLTALSFYQQVGFHICSDTFVDAGIAHKSMSLYLEPVIGENKLELAFDNRELCKEIILSQIKQAKHQINIFTQNFEPELFNQPSIYHFIQHLITRNRRVKVRIICQDASLAVHEGHYLIRLAQNYTSFVEIRTPVTKELKGFQQSWLMVDDYAYCHIQNVTRYYGTACFNNRLKVKESLEFFNLAWEESEIDQTTRRLNV